MSSIICSIFWLLYLMDSVQPVLLTMFYFFDLEVQLAYYSCACFLLKIVYFYYIISHCHKACSLGYIRTRGGFYCMHLYSATMCMRTYWRLGCYCRYVIIYPTSRCGCIVQGYIVIIYVRYFLLRHAYIHMHWNLLTHLSSWQLTCLVLRNEHIYLLKPKSIWSADETQEKRPLVERILQLDPIEVIRYIYLECGALPPLKVWPGNAQTAFVANALFWKYFATSLHLVANI